KKKKKKKKLKRGTKRETPQERRTKGRNERKTKKHTEGTDEINRRDDQCLKGAGRLTLQLKVNVMHKEQ
ncbi:hypothetical protein, partial [Escherichia coli]|uniref:hypothetical protein n=1 Tax=Escherichia coli TaxID=562 RepID=UPI001BB060E7